jgi:putative transcriptional regulatory protein
MEKERRKNVDFKKRLNEIINQNDENGKFEFEERETAFSKKYYIKSKKENKTKAELERFNLNYDYRILVLEVFEEVEEEIFLAVNSENTIQIMYCTEGNADIYSDNGNCYTLKKGNILMYKANNNKKFKYKFKSKKFRKILFILNINKLEHSFLSSISNKILYNWKEKILSLFKEDILIHVKLNSKIEIMLNQIKNKNINNINEYILFKTKVAEVISYILDLQINSTEEIGINDITIAENIKEIIKSYSVSDIPSIRKICQITGMSNYQLQTIFKEVEGLTIFQYIQKIKMNYAKFLLDTSPKVNILDVATEVGYDSPSKFSMAFKKFFGVLPSKYKKN